jgi:hypothetical protein
MAAISEFILIPQQSTVACKVFLFQMVFYDPRVGLNILLLDEASGIDMQPLMPSTKILQWQLG